MPILNFNLQNVASQITQVISLYDPAPAFQYSKDVNGHYVILDGNSVIRADGAGAPAVASSGFLASFDVSPYAPQKSGVYPLPANAVAVNTPSNVYGSAVSANDDSVYSVVQINSTVANVEPGFSRIRIDYLDSGNNQHTEYFDCPFYEGWDLTAQELNQVVSYVKGGVQLLQSEVDDVRLELGYAMSRAFWRGTSVSGQIQWLPATQGLFTGALTYPEIEPPYAITPPLHLASPVEEKSTQNWASFLSYNYPGVVGNNNYTGAYFDAGSDVSSGKASFCLTENTDGTLTFWFYPEETERGFQTNTLQFVIEWSGPISNTINALYDSQMVITCGTAAGTANGSPSYGSYGVGTDNGVNNGGYGVQDITEGTYDVVTPNGPGTVPAIFRWRLHPPAGSAGKVVSAVAARHFTSYTYGGSDTKWYGDGTLSAAITLKGATPTNPTISSISPTTMCVGNTVTVTGTNFSSAYKMYIGSLGTPVQNLQYPSSTTATFTVPAGVSAGSTTLIMSNGTYQTTKPITIAPTPQITSVYDTDSQQYDIAAPSEHITISGSNFGATQGTGSLQIGSTVITPATWSDNSITAVIPSGFTPGTYTLQVAQGCAVAQRSFTVASRAAVSGTPQLYVHPGTVTLENNQVEQFFAYVLTSTGQPVNVSNQATWKVNGNVGGDTTDGTISNLGLFTAPSSIATNGQTSTVSATYTYENATNPSDPFNGTVLTSNATVTLELSSARQSPYASITVISQLNIFLGDGRACYVPVGSKIHAYPGQYVYVQMQENIDPQTGIPIASNTDIQQVAMQTISALDPNVATVIYNLSGSTVDPYNHVIRTTRTVVLGIIDPSDGNWHSMWDIGLPPPIGADADVAHSLPKAPLSVAYYAEDLPAFTNGHEFTGSVIDYIDDLSGAHQKQLSALRKRANTLVTGNCFYNEKTGVFEVLDQLTVFAVNEEGRYKAASIVPAQEVVVKQGQFLVITDNNLHVVKVGEKLDPLALVVGVAMDRFYTHWPILPQYMVSLQEDSL